MLHSTLATALQSPEDAAGQQRKQEFAGLASQTSIQERESLYAATRYTYTGEGDVWDVGCAAGGSSYCLAAGIMDNSALQSSDLQVSCFDLFSGYSSQVFAKRFPELTTDLEIYRAQTQAVAAHVNPVQLDLEKDLGSYPTNRKLEIVHIDAAKSPELWVAIFSKISALIIPGKTVWIFQDFERARLAWQAYSLAELMPFGDILGGANFGTVYFRFSAEIQPDVREKIARDSFSLEERLDNVKSVFRAIRADHMAFFPEKQARLEDVENTVLAYCHHWCDEPEKAREVLADTSEEYLSAPGNQIYSRELLEARPVVKTV